MISSTDFGASADSTNCFTPVCGLLYSRLSLSSSFLFGVISLLIRWSRDFFHKVRSGVTVTYMVGQGSVHVRVNGRVATLGGLVVLLGCRGDSFGFLNLDHLVWALLRHQHHLLDWGTLHPVVRLRQFLSEARCRDIVAGLFTGFGNGLVVDSGGQVCVVCFGGGSVV